MTQIARYGWRWWLRATIRHPLLNWKGRRVTRLFLRKYGRMPSDGEAVVDAGDEVWTWQDWNREHG